MILQLVHDEPLGFTTFVMQFKAAIKLYSILVCFFSGGCLGGVGGVGVLVSP